MKNSSVSIMLTLCGTDRIIGQDAETWGGCIIVLAIADCPDEGEEKTQRYNQACTD